MIKSLFSLSNGSFAIEYTEGRFFIIKIGTRSWEVAYKECKPSHAPGRETLALIALIQCIYFSIIHFLFSLTYFVTYLPWLLCWDEGGYSCRKAATIKLRLFQRHCIKVTSWINFNFFFLGLLVLEMVCFPCVFCFVVYFFFSCSLISHLSSLLCFSICAH